MQACVHSYVPQYALQLQVLCNHTRAPGNTGYGVAGPLIDMEALCLMCRAVLSAALTVALSALCGVHSTSNGGL